jgi:hypothetical protein
MKQFGAEVLFLDPKDVSPAVKALKEARLEFTVDANAIDGKEPTVFGISTVKLGKVGASRYAEDATTDVRCVALALDDGPVRLWFPGDPLPAEVSEATIWIAHNAFFERCIFRHILVPRYGWPDIAIESWRCTLAMALAMGLPGKLERLGEALNLTHRKGNAAIMRKMAKPRKPRKDEDPNGIYWHDDPKSLEKLGQYCCQDVECEREAHRRLTPLLESEQRLAAVRATGQFVATPEVRMRCSPWVFDALGKWRTIERV